MNNIFISEELVQRLREEISSCQSNLNIISGFCKLDTLRLINSFCGSHVNKKLLVRFLPSDLSSGATDKEIYQFCKNNGWKLYVNHLVHAKTYIFDKIKCIVGSANLTGKGIGTFENRNRELSLFYELSEEEYNKIITLYDGAYEMTDELYNYIISRIDDERIIDYYNKNHNENLEIQCLLPEDFPDESTDIIELQRLKSYIWLKKYLSYKENREAYFGELSAKIHSLFVNEPRQYRKDIKVYLANLLDSIKNNKDSSFKFERPNYSEKVILVRN